MIFDCRIYSFRNTKHAPFTLRDNHDVLAARVGVLEDTGGTGAHTHVYSEVTGVAASKLLGRGDSGTGIAQAITLGTNLTMNGTTLDAAGGGGPHTHPISEVVNLQTTLDGKALASHTHPQSEVTNLVTDLGNKSNVGHTHSLADITDEGALASLNTVGTSQIDNDAVTYAKMQNVSAISKLLGRGSGAGAGDPEEITLGSNLSMAGTTLNAEVIGGGVSIASVAVPFTDGDTLRRVTITEAAVTTSSDIMISVRRPDTANDSADRGYIYITNIVRQATGVFDVLIACLGWGFDDPTMNPPNETITLEYIFN